MSHIVATSTIPYSSSQNSVWMCVLPSCSFRCSRTAVQNSHSHSIFTPLSQGHKQSQAGFGRSHIVRSQL